MKPHRTKTLVVAGMLSVASLSLVACSSPSTDAAQEITQEAPSSEQGQAREPMGVSGKIAFVDDGLMQVQDSESQTAVIYTDATSITQEVEASLSDVSEGVCITAIGVGDDSSSGAATVRITQPSDGECSFAMAGAGPEEPMPPAGVEMPEGMERPGGQEAPEGMPEGGFGGLGGLFTSGKVTAVNGSTITVAGTSMDGDSDLQEVVVTENTTFTKTDDAASDALVVGKCVIAVGQYEGEQYAAVSLAVSEAGEDGCDAGVGGGFPGRGER